MKVQRKTIAAIVLASTTAFAVFGTGFAEAARGGWKRQPPPPPATVGPVLAWAASSSTGVAQTRIYRANASGGPYSLLGSVTASTTSYTDTAVTSGTTYFYVVTAVTSAGQESGYSNETSYIVP